MYKLQEAAKDPHKFLNTWIGCLVEGVPKLIAPASFHTSRVAGFTIHGVVWDFDLSCFVREQSFPVTDKDMIWLPKVRPGYYNMLTGAPIYGAFLTQNAKRQYKVGLNGAVLQGRSSLYRRQHGVSFQVAASAFEKGPCYLPIKKCLTTLSRKAAGVGFGISRNFGIHKNLKNTYIIGYRAAKAVGIVEDGTLLVEDTFQHAELANMEIEYATSKRIIALYTKRLRAARKIT